jgi:hypothetical protein
MSYSSRLKSIYGGATSASNPVYYDTVPYVLSDTCCTNALKSLSSFFSVLESVVEMFFPSTSILAPMIANMSAKATVSDKVYVRLIWRHEYPGMVFSPDNLIQRLQIKSIYIQEGLDYSIDPLFMDDLGLTLL